MRIILNSVHGNSGRTYARSVIVLDIVLGQYLHTRCCGVCHGRAASIDDATYCADLANYSGGIAE
jgi:hypothetical protein